MVARLIIVTLCLVLGFAAGALWMKQHSPTRAPAYPGPTQKLYKPQQFPTNAQQPQRATNAEASGIPQVTSLQETAGITSEFLQSASLYAFAAPMNASGIRQLLEGSGQALSGGDYLGATSLLIGRYAELNFEEAIDYALIKGGTQTERWLRAIFHARARLDLDDAVARAGQLNRSQQIIAGTAILRSNNELTSEQRQAIATQLNIPVQVVATTRHNNAEAWSDIQTLSEPIQKMQAQMQHLMRWGQSDPWAALQASADIENQQVRRQIQGSLLGLAAVDDPQQVIDWLDAQPQGQGLDDLTANVITQLGRTDPDRALALMERLSGPARSQAELGYWTTRAAADPEGAAAWLASSQSQLDTPSGQRVRTWGGGDQMILTLSMTAPESAERFMAALPATTRDGLETSYVTGLAQQHPARAADRIERITDDSTRRAASQSLISSWTRTDASAATDWIERQPATDTPQLFQALGRGWGQQDAQAAEAYASRMRSGTDRDHMISGLISSGRLSQTNASELFELMDDQQLRAQAERMGEAMRGLSTRTLSTAIRSFGLDAGGIPTTRQSTPSRNN